MGNETSRTDYFGNKYAYVYDALNRPIQVTDPLNGVTGMVYDRMQHVLQIHYPNKTSVNTVYDATYDVASVVNKKDSGAIISRFAYTYDAVGNKLTVTDNIGKTTYGYDDIYQLTNAAYPDRPAVAYAYDPAGNRSTMTVGTINTTYSYDAANKLMAAGTVSYTYDGNGNPVKKTDSSNSQTTAYAYDTENRLVGTTLPTGSQFVFGYDYTGWKISDTQKGPGGIENTQTYLWSGGSVVNEDGDDGQIAHNLVGEVNLSQIYTPKATKTPMVSYYAFDGL
jgi:YD repeat-containing protein